MTITTDTLLEIDQGMMKWNLKKDELVFEKSKWLKKTNAVLKVIFRRLCSIVIYRARYQFYNNQ